MFSRVKVSVNDLAALKLATYTAVSVKVHMTNGQTFTRLSTSPKKASINEPHIPKISTFTPPLLNIPPKDVAADVNATRNDTVNTWLVKSFHPPNEMCSERKQRREGR